MYKYIYIYKWVFSWWWGGEGGGLYGDPSGREWELEVGINSTGAQDADAS